MVTNYICYPLYIICMHVFKIVFWNSSESQISSVTCLVLFQGGMKAVVWTDAIQGVIFLAGIIASLWLVGDY